MTKQEIDAMIDNGITAKIHEQLGVWSCNFFPFEEDPLPTNNDGEYDIEQIIKERNSTVYRGIRFYFDTPEQLKAFCMALEQKESAFMHNKIEFPEYNDGLLEEFDKQFFENGQDDDLTETAEQKD